MSTSVRGTPGATKKLSCCVRPGVLEVRARPCRRVSALMRLDLPTLERPANATSRGAAGGRPSSAATLFRKVQGWAKRWSPAASMSASAWAFIHGTPHATRRPAAASTLGALVSSSPEQAGDRPQVPLEVLDEVRLG